jgi:hypothetical protein
MAEILDCAGAHLNGQAVKNADYHGAIRYLRKEGSSSVVPIDVAEAKSLRDAGRSIAFVYQHVSKGRVAQGFAAGAHDATWAWTEARKVSNDVRAIYFAVDYDAPSSDYPKILEYARGFGSVIGVDRVGAYGKYVLLAYLRPFGAVSWYWQTVAWSGGAHFNGAHLYQKVGYVSVGGVQCDVNDCLSDDWGQEGGGSMALTITDLDQIVYNIKARIFQADNYREFGDNRNPGDCLKESARSSLAAAQGIAVVGTKVDALLTITTAIANDPDVTAEMLQGMINTAVTSAAPAIAAQVASQAAASLRTDLIELLQEDNSDQAEQVTDLFMQKLVDRLSAHAAEAASQ